MRKFSKSDGDGSAPSAEKASRPSVPVLCVVISYNSARSLPGLLRSLSRQTVAPLRVVVVDNASSDHSAEIARSYDPRAEVILNRRNVGYGRAANQIISETVAAEIPYILLLNPDVELEPRGPCRPHQSNG